MNRSRDEFLAPSIFETPAVIRSFTRSTTPPPSRARLHPPPSRSSIVQTYAPVRSPQASYDDSDSSIIVFGFSKELQDQVIRKFKVIGDIEEIKPGKGNWLIIRYRNNDDAFKALVHNGQVLVENTMIGVKAVRSDVISQSDRAIYNGEMEEVIHTSQFIKKTPRRYASFWENFVRYVLNFDY